MLAPQAYADDARLTSPVVITATRVEQNSFDLPVAIDVVEKKDIQDGQLQMTLSESLIRVPGITAQNRTNQSQDPQISSRGFGSRSSFGVRGVRVYVDGIPLTMPDGQGQPGIVDLSAIKSIEVMRGPFSALYGNSSGGVIQLFSEDAPKTPEIGSKIMFGSYDTRRQIMDAAGTVGNVEYLLNVSNFETDGYRQHSSGDKQAATAKFKIKVNEDTTLTSLINWFDQKANDPGGLKKLASVGEPSAFSTPTGVASAVLPDKANARVTRSHKQIGFNLEHNLNQNNAINLMAFAGKRDNNQVLATNTSGTSSRASVIARDFHGTDVRWDNKGTLASMPYTLSFGLNYGKSSDARTDTNITPSVSLNRDEDNIVDNFDQYAQGKLAITNKLDIHAGLRHTKVKLTVKDKYVPGDNKGPTPNGINSGSVEYEKTNPVIGAVFKINPSLNLYANYGRGFETPTFIEAAWDAVNLGKPNLTLKPSVSQNYEVGAKAFIADNTQVNLSVFKITTDNEIVLRDTNAFNRSIFANADKTKRSGAELSIDSKFANNISTYFSYSLLNAEFASTFRSTRTRSGSDIQETTVVNAGNKIPGTYSNQIYAEVAWKYQPLGFSSALEGRYNSKVYVNDANDESAPSYKIANIRAGFEQNVGGWNFTEFVRVENIFDKDYIGSVRVNDGNSRFYEPAADRNYLLSVGATYKF
ncbi:CirA Outer membrane receptor proteins, mostly Fe transport [Methylophilaceae bacterium]